MTATAIRVGDLLDEVADVIVSTANPWLNMSGGVNGAILLRGGEEVQNELHAYLRDSGKRAVEPGTVVVTGGGPLLTKHILHAVAIDPFYNSSAEIVLRTLERVLTLAQRLGAKTVAMPALATGYGRLEMHQFATAFAGAAGRDWPPVELVVVVVRKPENAQIIRSVMEGIRDRPSR